MKKHMYVELEIEGENKSATLELYVDKASFHWQVSQVTINGTETGWQELTLDSSWRWERIVRKHYKQRALLNIFNAALDRIISENAIDRYESENY